MPEPTNAERVRALMESGHSLLDERISHGLLTGHDLLKMVNAGEAFVIGRERLESILAELEARV